MSGTSYFLLAPFLQILLLDLVIFLWMFSSTIIVNHSSFPVIWHSRDNPITNPHPDPINVIFQSNPLSSSASASFESSSVSSTVHFFDNGNPHSPEFPLYESFPNVSNWLPRGLILVRLFWERFETSRNIKLVNSCGILPISLFKEKSNDSSNFKFPKDWDMSYNVVMRQIEPSKWIKISNGLWNLSLEFLADK